MEEEKIESIIKSEGSEEGCSQSFQTNWNEEEKKEIKNKITDEFPPKEILLNKIKRNSQIFQLRKRFSKTNDSTGSVEDLIKLYENEGIKDSPQSNKQTKDLTFKKFPYSEKEDTGIVAGISLSKKKSTFQKEDLDF